MSTYETLTFVHIVAAAVWIGAVALSAALGIQAAASADAAQITAYARQGRVVGALTGAASIVLIAFGVWAAADADIDFGTTWITIGMTTWLLAFLIAAVFYGPYAVRLRRAIASEGADSPRVGSLLRMRLAVAAVEIVLLVVAVWAMVDKPA